MKQILIITEPEDIHSQAVAWGLSTIGHVPQFWYMSDFPSLEAISLIDLDSDNPSIKIGDLDLSLKHGAIHSIWMFRFYCK